MPQQYGLHLDLESTCRETCITHGQCSCANMKYQFRRKNMDFNNLVMLPDEVQIQVASGGQMPIVGSDGAAGLDCFTLHDIELGNHSQMEPQLVSLGFHIAIPRGWVGLLVPRSSTFKKYRLSLANTVGVIDSDYRGEVMANVILAPVVPVEYMTTIPAGTRLCQLVLMPCADYTQMKVKRVGSVEELGTTARGSGGFGSTDASIQEVQGVEGLEGCDGNGSLHHLVKDTIADEVTDYYRCTNCGLRVHKSKVE